MDKGLWPSVPFMEAYPKVSEIEIEAIESGEFPRGQGEHMRRRVFRNNQTPQVIACSNPQCKQGGISIHNQVYFMIESREALKEFSHTCQGHEGTLRKKGSPCSNRVQVKIAVHYK